MITYTTENGYTRTKAGEKVVDYGQALLIAKNFRAKPIFEYDDREVTYGEWTLEPYYCVSFGTGNWLTFSRRNDWLRFISEFVN